jgi:ecotin
MKGLCTITALLLLAAADATAAADPMKAFPPADPGMVRHVLQLQKQADESAFKVELIVGKTVPVDEGNRYFFAGRIEEKTIEGWGFPRFLVSQLGPMAGTLMAIDPNAPKVDRFVSLGGEPLLVRYNSQVPIVVYVPEGVEVRYRLWSAEPQSRAIGVQ